MKFKIGIFGSAAGASNVAEEKARELAKVISQYKKEIIIINGATTGIPGLIANEVVNQGIEIWGYSAAINLSEHQKITPGDNKSIYKKLVFVPSDYKFKNNISVCRKYRNVTSTASCDAGIIISGRWGSMNEFTNLFDMGKIIGILTGTGGIADEMESLNKKIAKETQAKIFYCDNPEKLIKQILSELQIRRKRR